MRQTIVVPVIHDSQDGVAFTHGCVNVNRMKWSGLIDAHVHADGLTDADLDLLASFGVEQVLVCAHDGAIDRRRPTCAAWLSQYDRLLSVEARRLRRHGLRALFALGVHPAHAPERGLEELFHRLPAYLSHPAVVALGSLGVSTGDAREQWVLGRQLEMAHELRRPVLVSPPPLDPGGGMKSLLALLRRYELGPERILIERATAPMVPLLRGLGFSIALEASPGRLSSDEIVHIVSRWGAERFVLTSHAGEGSADVLGVPQLAMGLAARGLSDEVVMRVGRENALRFLGRQESTSRRRAG